MLTDAERQGFRARAESTGWGAPAVLALLDDMEEKDTEIREMRDALESIWGHWYANNVSTERAMEAIRELFAETEAR